MSWIRAADEERERRPADAGRCAVGVLGLAAAGNDVSAQLIAFFNGLPNALDGLARALVALGSVLAVLGFRTITFFLPPIAGFFTLRPLRNRGLV